MCITFAKTRQNYLFTFDVPRAELCLFHFLLLLCCWFCCSELFTGSFHLHATQMQAELSESKAETRLYNLNRLMTFSFPRPLEMLCIILICFFCPDFFPLLVCFFLNGNLFFVWIIGSICTFCFKVILWMSLKNQIVILYNFIIKLL